MSNLFDGEAKGEVRQLREDLDGNDPTARKVAAKRVVALMRQGDNVQWLFSSMLRCVKTNDLELKKLTYLYLTTYSAQEPEQAIMAVNTFIQDSQDSNPLVRALAVRTMCRIRLESVAENMILPLKQRLVDNDPYVRKTAAFGVSKLYDVIPEAVENAGLFTELLKLLKDDNPMVVANTTAAIVEINEKRTSPIFTLNGETVGPLLSAITSCTDWCQTILLDALAHYKPESAEDAAFLIDRLIPYLKHANPAVVIGSFKCIFAFMEKDARGTTELFPQIIPPFITLVTSAEPEIQYVVLRTLTLFVLKYPKALSKEIRVFFCKYNDPSYIKMQKLDIIVTICTPQTAQLVLDELAEYCNEVDVAFVRKSIRCIGQIAIKIEAAARRCVDILVTLVKGKADYAIEESVIVVCDILRKFPGIFESIISIVCQNLEAIKEPRAKAASIWILGEYANRIDGIDVLVDPYLDTFHDEPPLVQLQILSTLVKVYIEKPDETRDQLQFILTEATKDNNVPDVRNRAMIYWRLLSSDSQSAKDIVVFSKETVVHSGAQYDDAVLKELMLNMGSVSGVLHVVPSDFVKRSRFSPEEDDDIVEDYEVHNWMPMKLNDNMIIDAQFDATQTTLFLHLTNKTPTPLTDFALAVDKNAVGLTLAGQANFPQSLEFGASCDVQVPIKYDANAAAKFDTPFIQVAIKTSAGMVMGMARIPFEYATLPSGDIGQDNFRTAFNSYKNEGETRLQGMTLADTGKLASRNLFVVGSSKGHHYVSFCFKNQAFVAEVFQDNSDIVVQLKSDNTTMMQGVIADAKWLFAA